MYIQHRNAIPYKQNGIYIDMQKSNMKQAELDIFKQQKNIKRFVTKNYAEIKIGNPEYIETLVSLTGKNEAELNKIIATSSSEVELAHNLVKA